jgi:hypothetical protein
MIRPQKTPGLRRGFHKHFQEQAYFLLVFLAFFFFAFFAIDLSPGGLCLARTVYVIPFKGEESL